MNLKNLLARKRLVILGLNSGTSADAVDCALLRITRSGRGTTVRFIAGGEKRFPRAARRRLLEMAGSSQVSFKSLLAIDARLGEFFGRTAHSFLSQQTVHAIASHGQTIHHLPRAVPVGKRKISGSLQLGSLERIAARTGCVTIGDFRQGDIALGGEGAPITTGAMARLFVDPARSRLIVNIGGIANYFYLPAKKHKRPLAAADCGPGNMVIDALCNRLYGRPYDRNGAVARRGTISEALLRDLLQHPFLRARRRRSTGREEFGEELISQILRLAKKYNLEKAAVIATATELTARTIARAISGILRQDKQIAKLYLTGGGAHNKFLSTRLSALLPSVSPVSIETLGIPTGLVEAAAFAVMGEACLRGEALPGTKEMTAKPKPTPILGRIIQPPVTRS